MPPTLPFYFLVPPELAQQLARIELTVDTLRVQIGALQMLGEELKAELVKANNTTNEIAADLTELIAKLAGSSDPAVQEALDGLRALNTRLSGVAAQYTADAPPASTT